MRCSSIRSCLIRRLDAMSLNARPEVADLVARSDRHLHGQVAAGDAAHRIDEPADRSGEHLGEQQRETLTASRIASATARGCA